MREEVISYGTKAPRPAHAAAREERPVPQASLRRELLGARERQIVDARARGLLAKEIAAEYGIAESTVRVVFLRALRKLRRARVLSL